MAELNARITDFLTLSGERLTKDEWLARFPEPTEAFIPSIVGVLSKEEEEEEEEEEEDG